MNVQVKIINAIIGKDERFPLPTRATDGSAGIDLRACIDAPLTIKAGESVLVGTGLAIYIQNPDYVGLIMPRSGLGHKHGIVLGNLTGVIDADYQGELMVSIWNRSQTAFSLEPGERLAQYVLVPVVQAKFEQVDEFVATERGAGGFGHTGKN